MIWYMFLLLAVSLMGMSLAIIYSIEKNKPEYDYEKDPAFEYDVGSEPTWRWRSEIALDILKGATIAGTYRPEDNRIDVNLGSIMQIVGDADEAMYQLEETVVHELAHWADKHGRGNEYDSSGHSKRWRKVLDPLMKPRYEN